MLDKMAYQNVIDGVFFQVSVFEPAVQTLDTVQLLDISDIRAARLNADRLISVVAGVSEKPTVARADLEKITGTPKSRECAKGFGAGPSKIVARSVAPCYPLSVLIRLLVEIMGPRILFLLEVTTAAVINVIATVGVQLVYCFAVT